jgi:hypothetical protein
MQSIRIGALFLLSWATACKPVADHAEPPGSTSLTQAALEEDYLPTPAGYYHRTCIHDVENGSTVDQHGNVTLPDGSAYQTPPCRYRARSNLSASQPVDNGWVEAAFFNVGNWVGAMYVDNWTTPAVPEMQYSGNQVLFLFPGILSPNRILQPVLQYGVSAAGGGNFWAVSSWSCDNGQNCYHSSLVSVSPGTALGGSVTSYDCDGGGHCTYTINSIVNGTAVSQLNWRDGDVYSQTVGGALEVYNLYTCGNYPSNGPTTFSGIAIYDANLTQVIPSWGPSVWGQSPNCSFGINSASNSVTTLYTGGCGNCGGATQCGDTDACGRCCGGDCGPDAYCDTFCECYRGD